MSTLSDGDIVRTTSKEWSPTGGQSIPAFDHYMAPGVAKTFIKELYKVMCIKYPECSGRKDEYGCMSNEDIKEHLKQYIKEHKLILNDLDYVRKLIEDKYSKGIKGGEITRLFDTALKYTEDATHQAMEAVIHNLNSMHCLPYSERLWVLDIKKNEFKTWEIGKLTEQFEENRFKVISLNKITGQSEFKFITAAKKMDNHRTLIEMVSNQGAKVRVTDNHRVMTMQGKKISEDVPNNVRNMISPRGIKFPMVNNDICIEEYGRVRKDSPYSDSHIFVTEEFAEFMGYYMADGCLLGDTGTLCMTTCGKVPFSEMRELSYQVFRTTLASNVTYYENSIDGTSEKDIRFGIGRRLSRMIADKFGANGKTKHIPTEIMFATDNIKEAFLKAYFRCDGRKDRNYSEVSTVNKELQSGIALMILSLKGSPHYSTRSCSNGFDSNKPRLDMHFISLSGEDSVRTGIKDYNNTAFSIPKYDLSMSNTASLRTKGGVRYSELEDYVNRVDSNESHLLNIFINEVTEKNNQNSDEEYVYDISVQDNESFLTQDGLYVHNSRAGAQVDLSVLA